MSDFLLELRSEEIPARMQDRARDDLAKLFAAELAKAGLAASDLVTYATPRRLTLIARGLPPETAAVSEEIKGPKTSAPPQALDGFLRKTGLRQEQLVERDGVLFAVVHRPGRATVDVLAEAIPAIIRAFPWPKAMRWGEQSTTMEALRWVRPLQGIVALFGDDVVPCEIAGIVSGAATVGHRFHHPGIITIGNADDYVEKLRLCHVIVDQAERRQIIALGATMAARKAGLELVQDEGLLTENAGLTEWPVPLLGRFEAAFLDVPPEVIQLTARVNQKYFVCRSADGKLANAFVCTANIDARDGGAAIVEGNRKVLAARLSDAKFFYDIDLKVPLAEQAKKLDRIVFHEKLGTVADKVERVAKLAEWLASEGIVPNCDPAHARRAAELCKADLVTGMVGEFPELQGLMGGYYAAAQGENPAVAAAIRDHYKPVGQGDEVPTAPVTVAVSLADKLDTLVVFYAANERPTGSKDPYALRRAAIAAIGLILANRLRVDLRILLRSAFDNLTFELHVIVGTHSRFVMGQAQAEQIVREAADSVRGMTSREWVPVEEVNVDLEKRDITAIQARLDRAMNLWLSLDEEASIGSSLEFLIDRLKVQQREAGVRHDLIDAVFALGGEDDLVRLLARVRALQAFIGTEDGANLLAGYKRAANILKKEGGASSSPLPSGEGQGAKAPRGEGSAQPVLPSPDLAALGHPLAMGEGKTQSYTPELAETALATALDVAEPAAAAAIAREDFAAAMVALASLRAPIDTFFETVIVNDPDRDKRAARLSLLDRVRAAVHNVADFSKIEG